MSSIKCMATKCTYNESKACVAPAVEVTNCDCTEANCSKETECRTFRQK